jgi:DNA primase
MSQIPKCGCGKFVKIKQTATGTVKCMKTCSDCAKYQAAVKKRNRQRILDKQLELKKKSDSVEQKLEAEAEQKVTYKPKAPTNEIYKTLAAAKIALHHKRILAKQVLAKWRIWARSQSRQRKLKSLYRLKNPHSYRLTVLQFLGELYQHKLKPFLNATLPSTETRTLEQQQLVDECEKLFLTYQADALECQERAHKSGDWTNLRNAPYKFVQV